jgi:hypothetical protein
MEILMDSKEFFQMHQFIGGVYYNGKADDLIALEHVPFKDHKQYPYVYTREFKIHIKRRKPMQACVSKLKGYTRIGSF